MLFIQLLILIKVAEQKQIHLSYRQDIWFCMQNEWKLFNM